MSLAGKLFYQCWHRPMGTLRQSIRNGGPLAQARHRRAKTEMQEAMYRLPELPIHGATGQQVSVHLLTGKQFAYQTAFCLHTLAKHNEVTVCPEIYDDGSLDNSSAAFFRHKFPETVVHPHAELRNRLETHLPADRFPILRERWQNYPHLRKLIDVHLARTGWRLVLDSDLLFWRSADLLQMWSEAPTGPIHAIDSEENYGYPREDMARIAGVEIPPKVNVGLIGLLSESIDWEFLESASAQLIKKHGHSYYLEQALCAMLVARSTLAPVIAPKRDYITYPTHEEIMQPTAVMHHYVDLSRNEYHLSAWRKALA